MGGGGSVSQFRLLVQLKMSWFRSYPNIDRAETQDGSLHYPFLTDDQSGVKLPGDPKLKKMQDTTRTGMYEQTGDWKHGQEMADSVLESPGR